MDAIRTEALPPSAAVCDCFGHEAPIAEDVMLAALRHVHRLETPTAHSARAYGKAIPRSAGVCAASCKAGPSVF